MSQRSAKSRTVTARVCTLALTLAACSDPSAVDVDRMNLEIHVTGGFAGVDFVIEVDGPERIVRGIMCTHVCDFERGAVLLGLSHYQLESLARLIEQSGMAGGSDHDYGTQCCDAFAYEIEYRDGTRTVTVTGDSFTLPASFQPLVRRLQDMAYQQLPVVVEFGTRRNDWPADGLSIDSVRIAGDLLTMKVQYGGGCEAHTIDGVAYDGFLEGSPPSVRAAVAHDSRGDLCEALITSYPRFDLRPLARAHQQVYGGQSGTVRLRIDNPNQPAQPIVIDYTFTLD